MANNPNAVTGSGEFPTNTDAMTSVDPVPQPVQTTQPSGGGKASSSSSAGSDIGGALFSIGSKILPFLFAGGGPVVSSGYADGGKVVPQVNSESGVGIGYLVGALHERNFKGDPKQLGAAVAAAKSILAGKSQGAQMQPQQGFASGGEASTAGNNNSIQAAINQAMGLNTPDNTSSVPQMGSPVQPQSPTGMLNLEEGANSGNYQDKSILGMLQGSSQTPAPQARKKGGYMDSYPEGPVALPQLGYAAGGPQMPPQGDPNAQQGQDPTGQPLGAGQTFQGDGSVKGPGTSTSDSIPAKLSNGEFVMSAPAVKFFGVDKMTKMNEQGKQGFMQALGQVQQNQQQGQQGQPPSAQPQTPPPQAQIPPGGSPQGPPPGGMSKGGMAAKSGYCSGL